MLRVPKSYGVVHYERLKALKCSNVLQSGSEMIKFFHKITLRVTFLEKQVS